MAKFLITASYTAPGLKGLQKDKASGRREAVRRACESGGQRLSDLGRWLRAVAGMTVP